MIVVCVFNANPRYRRRHKETVSLVRRVLKREGCQKAQINVIFTFDNAMTKLNTEYLRHRRTTDVISFPLGGSKKNGVEGEVYVNLDQARRQAKALSEPFGREANRLVVHGTLHLLGYDDATKNQRAKMRLKEDFFISATN
jgi:rRNA maturation RNase YbeY